MRLLTILITSFVMIATSVFAQDIFINFEDGKWAFSGDGEASCLKNPHKIRFSSDKTRAEFVWDRPMTNYLKQTATQADYNIISYDSDAIVMELTGEQRHTPDGALVVWVLKPLSGDMYCWGRTDWPSTGCIAVHIRCPELPPLS